MATLMDNLRPGVSGLSHLVEAATALTALVESEPPMNARAFSRSDAIVSDDDENRSKKSLPNKASKKREMFPQKLLDILSDPALSDIVSWLPHGRSFVIIRPDMFTEEVLPKYLPPVDARASTKYPSFTRKLNRWGFRQATRGPDTGAFHHPLFRRDQPELCVQMLCQKSREKSPRRSLPPKKRIVSGTKPFSEGLSLSAGVVSDSSNASTISSDERSVGSSTNSTASSINRAENMPNGSLVSIVSDLRKDNVGTLPFISNDSEFVASTLRERDRNEVLKAAKAMLYESYILALRGEKP